METERPETDTGDSFSTDGLYLYEDAAEGYGDDVTVTDELTLLSFSLGDEWYAIDVTSVIEVLEMQPVTKLPHLPDHVVGVANVRGSVTSVIDLLRLMRTGHMEPRLDTRIVVVESGGMVTGLMADEVGAVLTVTADSIQPPLSTVPEAEAALSRGQVRLEDSTVLTLLDVESVTRSERTVLE
ncbi:MAG: chemotaxis protein CheW [Candidatus Eisenbacteria bacterium]